MNCSFVTNKARALNRLYNEGVIDAAYGVLDTEALQAANDRERRAASIKLKSVIPVTPFDYEGGQQDKLTLVPNEELFARLDAADGVVYETNESYADNYQYDPIETNPEEAGRQLSERLTEVLEGIGVGIEFKDLGEVKGIADTVGKMIYLSYDKSDLGTLTEEAAHMFVRFTASNDPRLYNRMMSDITKLPIYREVKDKYMPIYNDLARVKEEAIGQALREHLVLKRNDAPDTELRNWFNKVLDLFKQILSKVGIRSIKDYHNTFEITARKILGGEFTGEFEGNGTFFSAENATPLERLDTTASLLELRHTPQPDGTVKRQYYYDGKPVRWSVTEKIKNLNRVEDKEPTDIERIRMEWGTKGHNDLMHLWKTKLDPNGTYNFTPETPADVVRALSHFVDSIIAQFPGAKFRVEVPVYDGKNTASMIDLMVEDTDGRVHIFDYKFTQSTPWLKKQWDQQLKEYKRILASPQYGFKKFGQLRIIPILSRYETRAGVEALKTIEVGNNRLYSESSYKNPLPSPIERQGNERIDTLLDYLQEELQRTENTPANSPQERQDREDRVRALRKTISEVQVAQDVTPLVVLVESDRQRMEQLINKAKPNAAELRELYSLAQHYESFYKKEYHKDKQGDAIPELLDIVDFAQNNLANIERKLEDFWNTHRINIKEPVKPASWWSRLTRLSDYDSPAFQALHRILNTGFSEKEIKIRAIKSEVEAIIKQVRKETGKTDVDAFKPILQEGTPKLISVRDRSWYDMHRQMKKDNNFSKLEQWFDKKAWDDYFDPIFADYKKRTEPRSSSEKVRQAWEQRVAKFKQDQINKYGIGSANSRYYTIPDQFLNPLWKEHVRDKPDSGLAKLYNKYVEINRYAYEHCDTGIRDTFLPFVRKNTLDVLMDSGFNLRDLKDNALNGLKSYEWETFEIDSNGQRIHKIPLRFGTSIRNRNKEEQSYDLGEMLLLWTESVYDNAYLQQTHDTAQLYGLALEKSRQIVMRGRTPVFKNGELRTEKMDKEAMEQYQEYLNMYYYGVKNEDDDIDFMGYSMHKAVKGAVQWFSAKTLAFVPFSAFANVTGGFSNAVVIGSRGRYFTNKQLGKALTNLHDPKVRAFSTLIDVDNNTFDRNRASDLAISKVSRVATWDNAFILQKKGDWAIQNTVLNAMAQNYTVKDGKIIKREGEDKSLLELLDTDSNGKLGITGLDLADNSQYAELLKWRELVRSVNSEIIGTTSQQDKFLAGNTLTGQLLLQFRRWMLPMGVSRFGSLRYNSNLDEFQYGRYRQVAANLIDKRIFDSVKELITTQKSPTFQQILLDNYEKQRALNPKLTWEEYMTLYRENVKSVVMEAALFAALSAVLMGLRHGADDEDPNMLERFLIRAFTRTSSELSFWYSTDSFLNIVQVPIPLLSFLEDFSKLGGSISDELIGQITGDEEMTENAEPLERAGRMVVGFNAYHQFMNEMEKDYDQK